MKKFGAVILGTFLFFAGSFAKEYNYNFSVSPLSFLLGNINAKMEFYNIKGRKIIPAVEGSYWYFTSEGADYSAWTIGVSGRIYKDKKLLKGWFSQVGTELGKVSVDTDTLGSGSALAFGLYALGGYRWTFGSEGKYTVDVGLGAGYYTGSVEINSETYDAFKGFLAKGIFALGANF
ncbi:MAG: hypothetical protein GXO22_03040 [Aquificae bacterium]|nr:hypothetical protein [Aquificota bacterium]